MLPMEEYDKESIEERATSSSLMEGIAEGISRCSLSASKFYNRSLSDEENDGDFAVDAGLIDTISKNSNISSNNHFGKAEVVQDEYLPNLSERQVMDDHPYYVSEGKDFLDDITKGKV